MKPLYQHPAALALTASALLVGTLLAWQSAGSELSSLERQRDALQQAVDRQAAALRLPSSSLRIEASFRPLLAWIGGLPEQKVSYRSTRQQGQIDSERLDCHGLGSGGWYVELEDDDSLSGSLRLSSFQASATQNGDLQVGARFQLDAKAKLHGHGDPCVGGGVGVHDVRVEATAKGGIKASLRLLPAPADRPSVVPFRLSFLEPDTVGVRFKVKLPRVGEQKARGGFPGLKGQELEGQVTLPLRQSGSLRPVDGGPERHFTLQLDEATLQPTAGGLAFQAVPRIVWQS